MTRAYWILLGFLAFSATAAELHIDLGKAPLNKMPPGFSSLVAGKGEPGDWQVVQDDVTSLIKPPPGFPAQTSRQPVIAQLAKSTEDDHYPLLVYDKETFSDFTFNVRFKAVSGNMEQMAGVVFRLQDEKNFYVLRASSKGNNFRFYKMVGGIRTTPIGPEIAVPSGVWHDLSVQCKGNQIICKLNGRDVIPPLNDNSFASGKIGLWTKSDAISHFTDLRVTYTPIEPLAQKLVRDILKDHKKVEDLTVYAKSKSKEGVQVIGAKDPSMLGKPGTAAELEVLESDAAHFGRGVKTVTVILPLKDRNGEPVAAARFVLDTFIGETEQNAVARATLIVKQMQMRFKSLQDLYE